MVDQGAACGERDRVEALADQICARATQQAQATCRLIELIGEFDAAGGLGFLRGVKSLAHWLSYSCSMAPGVAREHVRVARALQQMPTITAAFRSGALSYSKVREATRLVGLVDEARLCDLARSATASQLARMITGYRTASGSRLQQQEHRRFGLVNRTEDQMTGLSGKLPAEEAGMVTAALHAARDRNQTVPPVSCDQQTDDGKSDDLGSVEADRAGRATPPYTDADALLDICQHYLNTAGTDDGSGEDRHLVVVEVSAEQLAGQSVAAGASVVDGTPGTERRGAPTGTSNFQTVARDMPDADELIADACHTPQADTCQRVGKQPAGVPAGTPVWDQAGSAAFLPRPSSAEASGPEHQDEVLETAHARSGVFDDRSQMSPAVIAVSDNQNSQLRPGPARAPLPNSVAAETHRRGARRAARSDAPSRQAIEQLIIEQAESVPAGTQMPGGAGRRAYERCSSDGPGVARNADGCAATNQSVSEPTDVPAGTSDQLRGKVCAVRGIGGIEPATAARLSCTGTLLGAVVDAHGDVLGLGRSRRLVSKTQRRALMIRDRMCQFPGCAQTRHLAAHHITPWSHGGRTDLEELILLCRFHHTAVHEGGIRINRARSRNRHNHDDITVDAPPSRWTFTLPDGEVLTATGPNLRTAHVLVRELTDQTPEVDHIGGLGDPDSNTIRPDQTGEPFDLHACVEALFHMTTPPVEQAA